MGVKVTCSPHAVRTGALLRALHELTCSILGPEEETEPRGCEDPAHIHAARKAGGWHSGPGGGRAVGGLCTLGLVEEAGRGAWLWVWMELGAWEKEQQNQNWPARFAPRRPSQKVMCACKNVNMEIQGEQNLASWS